MKRFNPKERGLVKGALRRVFSRSEMRLEALNKTALPDYSDANRPRVTKWGYCSDCGTITPKYLLEVDHVSPIIAINEELIDLTITQLVDRIWCGIENLEPKCSSCHKQKTRLENSERRLFKKGKTK